MLQGSSSHGLSEFMALEHGRVYKWNPACFPRSPHVELLYNKNRHNKMIFSYMSCQEIMQIQGVHPAPKNYASIYLAGCFACNPHIATTAPFN